jgi:hypothetical protein
MTEKYLGGYLTKNPIQPTALAAPGIWKLDEAIYAVKNNSWPQPIVIETPTFTIDLTKSTEVDPRLVFVRNSNATYYNSQGILSTAAPAEMRLDHDPLTGELLGVLVEEARTNLFQRSEELDNAYWTKSNIDLTLNAETAPDGTTSAEAITESEIEAVHGIIRSGISIDMSTNAYTISAFVKSSTIKNLLVKIDGGNGNDISVLFAMDFGFPILEATNGTAVLKSIYSQEIANGWHRISFTGLTGVNGSHEVSFLLSNEDQTFYLGDPSNSFYIWGLQLEQGGFLSSYIKTTGATAQRVADILTVLDNAFLNFYNENEGTIMSEGTTNQDVGTKTTTIGASVYLSADNNIRVVSRGQAGLNRIESIGRLESDTETRTFASFPEFTSMSEPVPIKFSIGLKKTEYPKISVNGGEVKQGSTGNSGIFPATGIPIVFLGNPNGSPAGSETVQNGHVKRFSYWNKRLSDQHLKYVSSFSYNVDTAIRLDFDSVTSLDYRITFSRNSAATCFNSAGNLVTALNDEARFDHDPVTNTNLGLLIEESRTNIVNYSEEIDNAYWTKANTAITTDSIVSPDTASSADLVLETTANSEHSISTTINSIDMTSATYSFSAFVKGNGRTKIAIEFSSSTNSVTATADITAKTISASSAGTGIATSSKIQELPNGWFRISASGRTAASGDHTFSLFVLDDSGNKTYAGDAAKGIYAWGLQIEQGQRSSSYIATSDSPVTREGDQVLCNSVNFTSWFNQSEGTIYWQGSSNGAGAASAVGFAINDNTTSERYQMTLVDVSDGTTARVTVTDGGTDVASLDSPDPRQAVSLGTNYKQIFSYNQDNLFFLNAGSAIPAQASTDTSASLPLVSQLSLGSVVVSDAATGFLNGHLAKFYYWNGQLPDWRSRDLLK